MPIWGFALSTETKSTVDAALVQAARERYANALQRYALRQLGGEAGKAKETLDAVWKSFQEQSAADISGELAGEWLFLNCRRRIQAQQGKGQAKRVDTGESEIEGGTAATQAGADENEEPHVTMQRLIDRLTPKQQEAVRLRFQNDFSVQEIARITELTNYNVGVLVHNAVAKLGREYYSQHPDEAVAGSKGVGNDARLTLYALGEMEDAERRSFEDSLIDKKNAGLRADEVRAIGALIGQALAVEAGAPAPHTVRKRKRSGLALWLSFPRVLVVIAGVVAVGLLLFFWLKKPAEAATGPRERIDFRLKPANWKEGDPLPEEGPKRVGAGVAGGGSTGGSESIKPAGVKIGVPTARRPAGQKAAVEKIGLAKGSSERHEEPVAGSEMPSSEKSESEPDQLSEGIPTGAVPAGVAAVTRGKQGERQSLKTTESNRSEGNFGSPVASAPVKVEGEQGEVDEAKSESTKTEAKGMAPTKQKPVAGGTKNKGDRRERKFSLARDAGTSRLPPDVAATSVGTLRKALVSGRRPEPKTVKVEELINYFPLAGAAPEGSDLFAATLEATEAPWDATKRLVRVSLKGKDAPKPLRGAASLVLLVDISGSMIAPNRLPLVKEAVRLLIGRLRPDDRVGVVTYAAEPRLALLPTPVAETQEILRVIEQLEAKGPTNGGAGMELAYDLAKAHGVLGGRNCVIMCTDGDFNSGPTREEELAKIIDRQADSGVTLSIYGFGRGRQIDARLEKLAMRGGGASGYVNTRREAERVLTGEINGIFAPLAKELEVKVVFNPEQVEGYRLLGYDEPTDVAAGKIVAAPENHTVLPGHTLTALYEVIPRMGAPEGNLLNVQLNYQTPKDGVKHRQDFALRDRGTTFSGASLDFKFAAAVGAFGLVLSDQAPDGMTLDTVEAWAKDCLGEDVGGFRSEFLALVEQARAIQP